MELIGLYLLLAGFVIGLGAVTVIDLHGFLGRDSSYWTEATIRTHKVTKPLIWLGITLALIGGYLFYAPYGLIPVTMIHLISAGILILNGLFLTFVVSPYLLKSEREGKANELLPKQLQLQITFSFIISVLFWWGNLLLLATFLVDK